MMQSQVRSFSADSEPTVLEMSDSSDWDKYLESDKPVVLQAGAHWCGPCQFLKPMLTKVSTDYVDSVMYVYMDIDKFPEIAEMLEIQHIPKTFMIYKGDLVDQFGCVPQDHSKIKDFFERAKQLPSEEE